jgi:hypothetical protein
MKKITAILSVLMLGACVYAGDADIFSGRTTPFKVWQTEKVFYYDRNTGEEFLSESKTITEEKIEKNVLLVTPAGKPMVSTKTYRTDFYSVENVQVNKNAMLNSTYTPVKIRKNADFEAFGEVKFNGEVYMLVRQDNSNDILLVDGKGKIFNKVGRMIDDRISVLDVDFVVEPDDVVMTPVINTRTEVSDVLEGFELIYNGIEDQKIKFTYRLLGNMETEDLFVFPLDSTVININDIKINIIDASYDKIEYILL